MRNLMSNMQFTLFWILGTIVALFATGIVSTIILLIGSMTAVALWGEEVATTTPTAAFIFITLFLSIIGLAAGLIFGSIQKALLRSRTDDPWRGWVIASAVGGIIGVDVTATLLLLQASQYIIWLVMPPPETLFWVGLQLAVVPLGCLGFAQMFVLWRHVHGAWTWVLANIVGGIVLFSLLLVGAIGWAASPILTILVLLGVLGAPGIVTAFAMVWLINTNWRHP